MVRWILFFVTCVVPASAIVIRDDLPLDGYAGLAGQEAFRGLVGVSGGGGLGARNGSGVLLNDEWVLTAAHVVWGQGVGSLQIRWEGQFRVVDSVSYPSGWESDPAVGVGQGADLALLRLASPLAFGRSTALASGSLLGEAAVMLGAGRSGNGLIGAFLAGGAPLGAMNIIDRQLGTANGGLLATDFDGGRVSQNALNASSVDRRYYDDGFVNPLLSEVLLGSGGGSAVGFAGHAMAGDLFSGLPGEFLEGTTAAGDSGGPWFVRDAAGAWELAGITSWGVNPLLPEGFARTDSRYGDVSFATDLTVHEAWITSTIPEPRIWWLAGIAGVCASFRRHSRPDHLLKSLAVSRRGPSPARSSKGWER